MCVYMRVCVCVCVCVCVHSEHVRISLSKMQTVHRLLLYIYTYTYIYITTTKKITGQGGESHSVIDFVLSKGNTLSSIHSTSVRTQERAFPWVSDGRGEGTNGRDEESEDF